MKGKRKLPLLIAAALLTGLVGSELLCRAASFHNLAGRLAGRGHLVAMANGKGIYETDLGGAEDVIASDLIITENLHRAAANEMVDWARVDGEVALLKAQFGDEKAFQRALRANGFSISSLREKIAIQLRGTKWLEKRIAPATAVTEQECRQFYDAHQDLFTQPVRFRASHLFLAAHAETPLEVVEEKEIAIAALAARLSQGESFSKLAVEASEDEATKGRGGDLGFFSEMRMPPEFMAEIQRLRVGEISKPFRSHLGFHIAQVTDIKAARLLTFEEVRPEISVAMENGHRAAQVDPLVRNLSCPDNLRRD
jgi:parvulin-like peptidyl-prolyl isomerase